jgi:hypothetical protein
MPLDDAHRAAAAAVAAAAAANGTGEGEGEGQRLVAVRFAGSHRGARDGHVKIHLSARSPHVSNYARLRRTRIKTSNDQFHWRSPRPRSGIGAERRRDARRR